MVDQANLSEAICSSHNPASAANDEAMKVVVIGAGPTSIRFAYELLQRQPNTRLTLFGEEPQPPYNRMKLTSLLAGKVTFSEILSSLPSINTYPNFTQVCSTITQIDWRNKCVWDEHEIPHDYDKLIIATGSRPRIPNILGVNLSGVFTLRDLNDAESLYNRLARARHVVVVGGGPLGLEAAHALLRANTLVTLIEQCPYLMQQQLDEDSAEYLRTKIERLGVTVITSSGVRKILGDGRVTGVITRDGDKVICDTVLLCTGTKPAIDLARKARIKAGRGIWVDDDLATSAENVYAIGDCCEHRGKVYGTVNPGFEQAAIAAEIICHGSAKYKGSTDIGRLQIAGHSLAYLGDLADISPRPLLRKWTFQQRKNNIYRKIFTYKGILIGAVGFGDWPELKAIHQAYLSHKKIYPWQYLRFLLAGKLWRN